MNKKDAYVLLGVFLLALFLRIIFLGGGALSFAYDQARDAFVVKDILQGDLKILGPPVSGIPGLYHGVLYYYILSLGYLIGKGNPLNAAIFMSILSSLVVFVIYSLTYFFTGKKMPSLLSAIIFALSFEATQYSNFLVNASMGVWFVPLMYLGLYLWLSKKLSFGSAIAGLGLGLAIQSEIALGYHIFVFIAWLYIFRKKISKRDMFVFLTALFVALLPLIISEVKFGYRGISGILYLILGKDAISQEIQFGQYILNFLNITGKTFAYTFFPINIAFGGLLGSVMLFSYIKKEQGRSRKDFPWRLLLLTGVMAHLIALPFGGSNMSHIMVGAVGLLSVMTGILIWDIYRSSRPIAIAFFVLIVSANLIKIYSVNTKGQLIFPYQKDLTIANEKNAVDFTYREAQGKPFSINSLTSPLYINTLWSYLYDQYGFKKYGYLPGWTGKDQIGQPGNILNRPQKNVTLHFYIIEPTTGIPDRFIAEGLGEENSKTVLIKEVSFGELKVQERIVK